MPRQLRREGGGLVLGRHQDGQEKASGQPAQADDRCAQRASLSPSARSPEAREAWVDRGHEFTTSIGTPIDPRNLYREFKDVCKDAGLGDWHPHELRHSAASLILAQGVKLQVVSEVLGHSSIRMTADVYGHILAPDRQAAADAMTDALWSDIGS